MFHNALRYRCYLCLIIFADGGGICHAFICDTIKILDGIFTIRSKRNSLMTGISRFQRASEMCCERNAISIDEDFIVRLNVSQVDSFVCFAFTYHLFFRWNYRYDLGSSYFNLYVYFEFKRIIET